MFALEPKVPDKEDEPSDVNDIENSDDKENENVSGTNSSDEEGEGEEDRQGPHDMDVDHTEDQAADGEKFTFLLFSLVIFLKLRKV